MSIDISMSTISCSIGVYFLLPKKNSCLFGCYIGNNLILTGCHHHLNYSLINNVPNDSEMLKSFASN